MNLLLSFLLLFQPGDAHQALTPGAVRSEAATYKVAPGRLLTLRVTSVAGKPVRWFAASTDVDLVPWPDGTQAIFCSVKPGVYRLAAWSADKDGLPTEATVITVTVEGTSPVVPPDPPGPKPPEPKPEPQPTGTYAAAWLADKGSGSTIDQAKTLAAIYKLVSEQWPPNTDTPAEIVGRLATARRAASIDDTKLQSVRKQITAELDAKFNWKGDQANVILTADQRKQYQAEFARIAKELEGLR